MKHNYTILLCICMLCAAGFSLLFSRGGARFSFGHKTGERGFLIGISQANLLDPRRIEMNSEIEKTAKAHPEIRCIFMDAAMSTERQLEDMDILMGYAIDLLIVSPNDSDILGPHISAIHKKIPVIVLDRDISGDDYSIYIGPDNYCIGKLASEYVIKTLGHKGGNIIEIRGREDTPLTNERSRGFYDALSAHENCIVRCKLTADWMQDQAEDRMKEYLSIFHDPIDVIFAHNDAMAYGAFCAMQKLRAGTAFCVGVDGQEGEKGGKTMVERAVLSATVTCPTGGTQAIEYALQILHGVKDIPHRIILEPSLITNKTEAATSTQNIGVLPPLHE